MNVLHASKGERDRTILNTRLGQVILNNFICGNETKLNN